MRTFIAIDLDEAIRRQLGRLQERLRPKCPGLRWGDADQIHLTIKFLGEAADQQIPAIAAALDRLAARCAPFEIAVRNVGTFGERGPVRVLWVGLDDPTGALQRCHAVCEELVAPLGFPTQNRPFRPHLTLARCNNPRNSAAIRAGLGEVGGFDAGSQSVERVTLYHSTLTAKGPIHEVLSTHPLTASE